MITQSLEERNNFNLTCENINRSQDPFELFESKQAQNISNSVTN